MRAHVAEFIGTFSLVFFGCGAIAVGTNGPAAVALAFGLAVAAGIYALGHISGAHFNPAVSVAFAVGRHFPWRRVATYTLAQTAGALAAAALLRVTLGDVSVGVTLPAIGWPAAFVWELLMTLILAIVVTAVATDTRAVGQAAALAVGATITLAALVGGPVTGASLNPARSLGPAIVAGDLAALPLYVVAPLLGAAAGALLYGWLRGEVSPAAGPGGRAPA